MPRQPNNARSRSRYREKKRDKRNDKTLRRCECGHLESLHGQALREGIGFFMGACYGVLPDGDGWQPCRCKQMREAA